MSRAARISRFMNYLRHAGWYSDERGRFRDHSELLGRYDGRTRWMMAAIVVSAVLLIGFGGKSSGCDSFVVTAMGGPDPEANYDQWKQTRDRETIRLCKRNRNEQWKDQWIKVCDD